MKVLNPQEVARIQAEVLEEARAGGCHEVPRSGPGTVREVVEPVPELEEHWDVWKSLPLTSSRRRLGPAVVGVKRLIRALLGMHDRELLRRQRLFNEAAKDELQALRQQVAQLRAELRALQRGRGQP